MRLSGFSVEGYKTFKKKTPIIDLAPITIVLGRNNSGKSALCRAPLFFSHMFREDAWTPFPLEMDGIDFGMSLQDISFGQRIDGFKAELWFKNSGIKKLKTGGASISEKEHQQIVTQLSIQRDDKPLELQTNIIEWNKIKAIIKKYDDLKRLPSEILWLSGIREKPERRYKYQGARNNVGASGKYAPLLLAHSKLSSTPDSASLFKEVKNWFKAHLAIDMDIDTGEGAFTKENSFFVKLKHASQRSFSNLVDAGEGIAQALPVVVAVKALPFHSVSPKLYIIEQPELHLHPYAHAAIAELMIEAAQNKSGCHFLIETHSESFVLRIRRAIAERRLSFHQATLYFVDECLEKDEGSGVTPINLNDRGTPNWWPEGIFAEDQREYTAIRTALRER